MTHRVFPPSLPLEAAVFLDFDGTLAPIQDDPETVFLPTDGQAVLEQIARQQGGALALISGRDVRDLSARVPGGLWRAGGHGLEICAPGERPAEAPPPAPEALEIAISQTVDDFPGARIEPKGRVIAIHYRAAPDLGPALEEALGTALQAFSDYRLQHGKMVFEAKPADAHKGRALARMLQMSPFEGRMPVMVGDDTTDEDAMAVALEAGGWAVKVGEGDSVATYGLHTTRDVWAWLKQATA